MQLRTKSFVFRPRRALSGKYSIGFAIEASGGGAMVVFNWCGSQRQIHLLAQLSSYMTNLRLPVNLSAEDTFVLSVTSTAPLILAVDLWKEGQVTDDIALEEISGETAVKTVCANPATDRDRKFEDSLVLGQAPVASRRRTPVGCIEALRPLPEGATLYLVFHRGEKALPGDILITAVVGSLRQLCLIAAGKDKNGVHFWLQPKAEAESWPLILYGEQPFTWSAAAQRGYDEVFLPAFSLVDPPEGGDAAQ
jgi:hypothetical protein